MHERDEKGNLKPIVVEIEKGVEIKVIPIPEGEIGTLTTEKGYEIVAAHILDPKLTAAEIKEYGRAGKVAKAVQKLLEISDAKRESFRDGSGNEE